MPTQNFKVGEMLNKRTLNSKTWMNFDGSYTTEIHSGIVHYEDVNGNLQNIDTDLQDEADFDSIDFPVAKDGDSLFFAAQEKAVNDKKKNKLNRDNFDFQGLKVPFEAKLPRNIKRGYSIGKGASKLKFIPKDASPSKGYVEGNKITYQDVWNDADLVLEVLPNGIKETIILKSERAPFNFSFEVQGDLNSELMIQPPWLQDAAGTKRDVVQGVEEVDGKTVVNLAADVTGLVYPIEIDPTVTIQPDGTAGKDAYVQNGTAANSNFGAGAKLFAGRRNNGDIHRAYLQFDVSLIPSGAVVTSAVMDIFKKSYLDTGTQQLDVYKVLSSWLETSITWNNQPSFGTSSYFSFSKNVPADTATVETYSFTITNLVNEWVSNASSNFGLLLKKADETVAGGVGSLFSSDDANYPAYRPKLTITYNQPPTAPTVTSPNGGETWNSLHTVEWSAASDTKEIDTGYNKNPVSGTTISSTYNKLSQTFLNTKNGTLKEVKFRVYSFTTAGTLRVHLFSTDANGKPLSSLAYSDIALSSGGNNSVPFNYAVTANTKYAIRFQWISGEYAIGNTGSNGYADGTTYNYLDQDTGADHMVLVNVETVTNIQYQIQLSTDNGATWKDIVALTTAGATSYGYDFINEAESSTAKIRIRAYDGSAYGPWDESDGVFTIQHNQAPTAPTNLNPSSGTRDRASVNRLSWQHNDANLDPQAKFDLQWRVQGASTWNDVSQATVNQYYDVPANLFPRGTIEWRVRTYDQAGLSSPYSAIATFFAGDKPAAPTIVEPGTSVAVANPTVQWSSVGQTGYKLTVKDTVGNTVFNSEKNSTNKAETITYNLANQTDYDIELRIKNADGLYSEPATLRINVSYTPPAIPDIETVKGNGFIQIDITDQAPEGTQPAVTSHDIYKEVDGEFVLIATWIANEFKDYQVANNETVRYFVRTFGDNGTFSDTSTFSESITFSGVWMHSVDDPSTLYQFKYDGDGRGSSWGLENAIQRFAGRRNPVMEIGEMEDYAVNFSLQILDEAERIALERIVYSGETVCYRDGRGRKAFGVFVNVPLNDEKALTYSTSLTLMKIDFKEAIE